MTGIGGDTDPIRARLDEHHMFRGQCSGCVRHFGGLHYECAIQRELDALRAVLDACKGLDDRARHVPCAESYNEGWVDGVYEVTTEIEAVLAAALGVSS